MKAYLEAGEIVATQGLSGEIKIYPWSDDARFLTGFQFFYLSPNGGKPLSVKQARTYKNMCIVKLEGIDRVEEARTLIGKTVYISRAEANIGENRVFVQDLLGARVVDANTGVLYGRIKAITKPGRHDVYEITGQQGQTYLFPAVKEFLAEVDVEEGLVKIRPIPGMFTEAEPV